MRKVTLLFLLFAFPILMFSQTSTIDSVKKEIENEITIAKSEIKNCNVKLKINKNDGATTYTLNQYKTKLKDLKNDLKIVKKTIKAEKKYNKLLKKFNKQESVYENQVETYNVIKKKY